MTGAVPRVAAPDAAAFHREYVAGGRPVVVGGEMSDWPALERWCDLAYLTERAGSRTITVNHYPESDLYRGWETREMDLATYIGLVESGDAEQYYASQIPMGHLPELSSDIRAPRLARGGDDPAQLERALFFGRESLSANHYHIRTQVLLCQLVGRKRVTLYPPGDTRHLDPMPLSSILFNFSAIDFNHPSAHHASALARTHPIELVLEPGEMLFIPLHWWHLVRGIELSISVAFAWRAEWRHWVFPDPGLRTLLGVLWQHKTLPRLRAARVRARGAVLGRARAQDSPGGTKSK
jgi:Cupin-like domain